MHFHFSVQGLIASWESVCEISWKGMRSWRAIGDSFALVLLPENLYADKFSWWGHGRKKIWCLIWEENKHYCFVSFLVEHWLQLIFNFSVSSVHLTAQPNLPKIHEGWWAYKEVVQGSFVPGEPKNSMLHFDAWMFLTEYWFPCVHVNCTDVWALTLITYLRYQHATLPLAIGLGRDLAVLSFLLMLFFFCFFALCLMTGHLSHILTT